MTTFRLMQARATSLHEALRLAMELESCDMAVRQSPSIRAETVTGDSASNEKTPEYEQMKETLLVVADAEVAVCRSCFWKSGRRHSRTIGQTLSSVAETDRVGIDVIAIYGKRESVGLTGQ
ncbi:hypothetical protein LSAT2_022638 [Lamellibrachia satsuma]|nr:hypothetical protein LSAT2_022638 [Lamellibrachia satsuma]